MTSPWARLAVLVLAARVSDLARANPRPETDVPLTSADSIQLEPWTDPVPGAKPLFGLYQHHVGVARRDCLSNGSNYCFGNNVDYCPGCGSCCVESKHCCDGGKLCCGAGCCPAGQTCSDGKCLPAVAPVTITSTVSQTLTHVATQRVTIVIAEIETSTAISTVEVTISTAATQTDVIWTTVTAVQKRAAATPHLPRPNDHRGTPRDPASVGRRAPGPPETATRRLMHALRDVGPNPRRDASTVITYITEAVDVTSVSSTTITTRTTSTEVANVYQTNTRVLQAEATITVTSTLTLTSRPPALETVTTTASLLPPTTSTTDSPAVPSAEESPSPALPTPTIAGIAAGGSVLAILLAGFVILSIRRRHRAGRDPPDDTHTSSDRYHHSTANEMHHAASGSSSAYSTTPRRPVLPRTLPHFASAPPAHHDAQFHPPAPGITSYADYAAKAGTSGPGGGETGYPAANQAQPGRLHHHQQHPPHTHHQRNSSGLTTLVGTPSPTAAAFKQRCTAGTNPSYGPEATGSDQYHHHHHHHHRHDNDRDENQDHLRHHTQDPPHPETEQPTPAELPQETSPHSPLASRERVWWAELDSRSALRVPSPHSMSASSSPAPAATATATAAPPPPPRPPSCSGGDGTGNGGDGDAARAWPRAASSASS